MATVTVLAPGKVNLTLDILGVLPNGYHEMEMLMHAVSLENTLTLTEIEGDEILVSCSDPAVPLGEKNLVYKAAKAFFAHCGKSIGVSVHIEKKVPMEAGMAGGSADAAGMLVGLDRLMGTGFSLEELCGIGVKIGADVPFCLVGGAALVKGIGEKITPLSPLRDGWLVAAKPSVGVKTAGCFARYDALTEVVHPDTAAAKSAIEGQDLTALGSLLENVLEQAADLPSTETLRKAMLSAGALGARMTGSGSVVFSLFADKASAEKCIEALSSLKAATYLLRFVPYGAHVIG